jgi:hypothetical protein
LLHATTSRCQVLLLLTANQAASTTTTTTSNADAVTRRGAPVVGVRIIWIPAPF